MPGISSNIYYGKSFVLLQRDRNTAEVGKGVVEPDSGRNYSNSL